jgi:hypothetical protein
MVEGLRTCGMSPRTVDLVLSTFNVTAFRAAADQGSTR